MIRPKCSIGLLMLMFFGCTDQSADPELQRQLPAPSASARNSNTPQTSIESPADASLFAHDYVQAGMPSFDRTWSGSDLAKAVAVLENFASTDAAQLPRYRSKKSGLLFDRLTADDNLGLYRNKTLPLELRLPDAMQYLESFNKLSKVYLSAFIKKKVGDSELIENLGATLRITVVMISLVNEFLQTIDINDPNNAVRKQGLEQMKNGMSNVVAGALQTLTESSAFRSSERKRLCRSLQSTLPEILPELSDATQAEFRSTMKSFIGDSALQNLNPELSDMVSAVEKALNPDSPPDSKK